MNSLPPEQRTITTQDVLGSKIEAIPGMGVCDFCTDIPVTFRYPCGLVVSRRRSARTSPATRGAPAPTVTP
jgi:hypothetical protein